MNEQIIELMLREKREDLLREAERQRLLAQCQQEQNQPLSRFAVAIGNLLIRLGERLKARYATNLEALSGACCQK